jgi:hypothetical protein
MKLNELTASSVAKLQREAVPGHYLDGAGLYLVISTFGTSNWIYRYRLNGRVRDYGLGSARLVSLSEARQQAMDARARVRQGIDIVGERKRGKLQAKKAALEAESFKDAALEYHKQLSAKWKSDKQRHEWRTSLERYAFPSLGSFPVREIEPLMITDALAPIWQEKHVTASRVRQRIEAVIDWVKAGKPLSSIAHKVKHQAAMPIDGRPPLPRQSSVYIARLRSSQN